MPDPLAAVWERADGQEVRFTGDDIKAWGGERTDLLVDAGLIRPAENADCVACDACADGHVEEITYIESPLGSPVRAYIYCSENGRVAVPLERLREWAIDFDGLARAIASGLDLAGEVEEVACGRIWYLGRATIGGRSRGVFLARGTSWTDALAVFGQCERLNASTGALVLVPGDMPPRVAWTGNPPAVVPLRLVTRLGGQHLTFDRDHLESLLTRDRRKAPVKAQESFPTPPGTRWQEVALLVTDATITVEAKRRRRDFSFQAAGFEERRKGDEPDAIWGLLKVFARCSGVIPFDGADLDQNTRTNVKQYVSVLRQRLVALIPGFDGDPIPYVRDERSYRAAFKIASRETLTLPVPDGTRWPDVTIQMTGSGAIRVAVPALERYAASAYVDGPDGESHSWESAERESEREWEYDLRMLGLAHHSGCPDRRGAALLEVLRGGGVVARPADDEGMLGLCGVLTSVLDGVEGAPFDFVSGQWVALFQTPASRP